MPDVISAPVARKLASLKVKDVTVKKLTLALAKQGFQVGRINPCIYGICIDFFTDKTPRIDTLLGHKGIASIEIFPYGIIDWDRFHVKVGVQVGGA